MANVNAKGEFDLLTPGAGGEFVIGARHLDANTPYLKNPTQVRLITPPRGLLRLPEGQRHVGILKNLLETRNKSWTGIDPNFDIEAHTIPWGWSRQTLSIPSTLVRRAMTPTLTADAYYNNINSRWWRWFAQTLYAHPDTQHPNFAAMDSSPESWMFEDFSFSCLAWEPDAVYSKPIHAVIMHGMTLSNLPDVLMARDVNTGRVGEEHALTFNCVYEDGENVEQLAQTIMDAEKAVSINPELKPVDVETIAAEVQSQLGMADMRADGNTW